jgi:hypothetical protein
MEIIEDYEIDPDITDEVEFIRLLKIQLKQNLVEIKLLKQELDKSKKNYIETYGT